MSGGRWRSHIRIVVDQFQKLFHGDGTNGLMLRERWVARDGLFGRLSARLNCAVFTGRLRWEAELTLQRYAPDVFCPVIGADDVSRYKADADHLADHVALVGEVIERHIGHGEPEREHAERDCRDRCHSARPEDRAHRDARPLHRPGPG